MSGYPVRVTEDATTSTYRYVQSPGQRPGVVISFPIDNQSHTAIGWVTASDPGATSLRMSYADAGSATGVALEVVLSTQLDKKTSGEAETLMDAAGNTAGGEYVSRGFFRIPLGGTIERSFTNDDNLLKHVYVRSKVAETGASILDIELTEPE